MKAAFELNGCHFSSAPVWNESKKRKKKWKSHPENDLTHSADAGVIAFPKHGRHHPLFASPSTR